jgi:hypothetical protein
MLLRRFLMEERGMSDQVCLFRLDGFELRIDWSYLAVLNREVYEADMRDLCGSLENGLKFIRRQQERGIGSDTGQGMRRR